MKVIMVPEAVIDKVFDNVLARADVWKQVCANKPDILLDHFKLELTRLKEDIKNG